MKSVSALAALLLIAVLNLTGCDGVSEAAYNGPGAKSLPQFSFVDLEGVKRNSREWQNKLLVINFWALGAHPVAVRCRCSSKPRISMPPRACNLSASPSTIRRW